MLSYALFPVYWVLSIALIGVKTVKHLYSYEDDYPKIIGPDIAGLTGQYFGTNYRLLTFCNEDELTIVNAYLHHNK